MTKKLNLALLAVLLFSCNNSSDLKMIRSGDFILEGNITIINHDTIFNGPIKYFDRQNSKIVSLIEYWNNKRNGTAIEYYLNGSVYSRSNFIEGLEHGKASVFDSLNNLKQEKNFYYGIEVGSIIDYNMGKVEKYHFVTFDGMYLYKCEFKSPKEIVEQGRLLNYVTNYYSDGEELKMSIFLYLISPPHKRITYKLYDKDNARGDSTLIFKWTYDSIPFKKINIDVAKEGHEYLWNVEAFYPSENITIDNVINSDGRKLILPREQ